MNPVCKHCKEGNEEKSQLRRSQEANEGFGRREENIGKLKDECEELRSRAVVPTTEESTGKLKDECEELREENIGKLKEECEELRSQPRKSQEANEGIERREENIGKLKEECEELRSQLKKIQEEYCSFKRREENTGKLKEECEELRSQLKKIQEEYCSFKRRMGNQASAEIGSHREAFKDINNPCRADELKKSYEKLKRNVWPTYVQEVKKIQEKKGGTDHLKIEKEKEKAQTILKTVFEKAAENMKTTRKSFEDLFKISDTNPTNKSNKRVYYMEMAIQKLQMMILSEDCTYCTDVQDITHNLPDHLCNLAYICYKQGCLMALHNPPLTLAWTHKMDSNPFPPIAEETQTQV